MVNINHDFLVEDYSPKNSNTKYYLSLLFAFALNLVLFFFLMSFQLFGQTSGGGYSEAYSFRDIGSRAISMGGAYTAISSDPTTLFYNPAGLASLSENASVVSSVTSAGYDRFYSNFIYGQSLNENFGIGIGLNSFNSGAFTARNNRGQEIGRYIDWQYNMSLGLAYRQESMSIGGAIRYYKNNLQMSGTYANGFGIDVGTKFNVMDLFSFGASVQNIGGNMIWNTEKNNIDHIPYRIRTGVAWEYGFDDEVIKAKVGKNSDDDEEIYVPATKYLLFSLEGVMTQHQKSPSFVFGAEAIVHQYLGFRGGITVYGEDNYETKLLPMNNWALGITLRPEIEGLNFKTHIDYSVAREFLVENQISHNISIFFEF